MIQIEIPGKGFLQMPENASIGLKLNNPVFADNNFIPGDYSFPFDISGGDFNGHNAWLLAHPDIPENATGIYEIPDVKLYIDQNLYRTGTLIINKASSGKYSINFRFGFKNIRSDFGSFKIRDLIDEEIVITTETYNKQVVIDYDGQTLSTYKLIVNGTTFEAASMTALATAINNDPDLSATYFDTGDHWGITENRILISPQTGSDDPATEFTVKFEAETNSWQWHITGNPQTAFLADYEIFLDTYRSAVNPYLFFPYMAHANYFNNAGLTIGLNRLNYSNEYIFPSGTIYTGSIYQPYVSLKYIFESITNEFGIVFEGDFFTDLFFDKMLFYNAALMAYLEPYIEEKNYMFYRSSFNVRELVPDISISDLLKGLQAKWNLDIIFNKEGNKITVNYRKQIANSTTYVDYTAISSPVGELDFTQYVTGYKLITATEPNDSLDSDDSYTLGTPGDSDKIMSSIGSIKQNITSGPFLGPYVRQEAGTNFIPRIFFYVGEVTNVGITYQQANYKGLEVNFAGVTGLGETSWKEWLHLIKGRMTALFTINLEFRHINSIDWEQKVMIDGSAYLIKSIDVKIAAKGIEPAKVELYKI